MTHPTVGTRDFHVRGAGRWRDRRSFGMDRDGLWGMVTHEKTPWVVYHKGILGWTASVSAFGRTVLIGRMEKADAVLDIHVTDEDDELW